MQPTPDQLRKLILYCPVTGLMWWKPRDRSLFVTQRAFSTWNARFANKFAFTATRSDGYKVGRIDNVLYRAHRVGWAIFYGVWPDEIDHENGDPTDNRILNLRDVTHQINGKNCVMKRNNTSGHQGVSWNKPNRKWDAYIKVDGVKYHLGSHVDKTNAVIARQEAERLYGFHPNHGRN